MVLRSTTAGAAALAAVVLPAAPARAAHVCQPAVAPGVVSTATPYEARLYDLPRLASLATGRGVRVAVVDSGVDARHPQLTGRVDTGRDLLHGDPTGRQDCVGHGTGVASIIAARPVDGVPFHGLAPQATVVPVRISEREQIGGERVGVDGSPAAFARAIAWAADPAGGNAQVINLSLVLTDDDAAVRRAVARAVAAGVVVVAAAGNVGPAGPTPYPAAYPGVIGVAAVTAGGVRAAFSQRGAHVDLAAAGDGVTVAAPGAGHRTGQGTSYAAPYVSATAALILQRFPAATPAQVQRRLIATADPAPGGVRSDDYGYGLLNPYRALTETLGSQAPVSPGPAVLPADGPAAVALRVRRDRARDRALIVGAAGAGAVTVAGLLAVVLRRGRRRGWRPAGQDCA